MKRFYKLLFILMSLAVFLPNVIAEGKCYICTENGKESYKWSESVKTGCKATNIVKNQCNVCNEENLKKVFDDKNIDKENDIITIRMNCYYQNGIEVDYQGNKVEFKGCTKGNQSYSQAYDYSGRINSINWTSKDKKTKTEYSVNMSIDDNIKYEKQWHVVGVKNGEVQGVYFAGCYRGYLKKVRNGYKVVQEKDTSVSEKPVYYVKVLTPNSDGTCNTKANSKGDIFVPEGITLEYQDGSDEYGGGIAKATTSGEPNVGGYGFQNYYFNKCPAYFNLGVSYISWWPGSDKNAFIFSDNTDISFNPSWIRKLFGGDDDGAATGTTSTDTEELNRITKCYDNIATSIIPKYTCTELNSFADKIYNEQKSCNNNHSNFFRDVDENIQTQMLQKIVTALNNKASNIVSCQFSTCNVANGSLVNKVNESSLPSCLKSCVSELKISDTLEGNTYTNNCAACYRKFYNELQSNNSITAEQKSCLDKQVDEYNKQLNKLQSNFADTVDEDMDQATEDHAESTASSTTTYTKWDIPEIQGGAFGRGGTCTEILGGTNGNGVKILNGIITTIRILAPIVAIINAMILLIPAVTSKDADGLKKASSKCVKIAIILAIVEIFPSVIKLIGALFGWDTCGIK